MTFFLTYWKELLIAAITAIVLGYTYHAGGSAPRAELAALRAAGEAYKQESARIAKEKDDEYHKSLAALQHNWDTYRLQHPIVKAIRISTGVCADKAGNTIVSDAISAYVASISDFRGEVEGLLKQCDSEREQLSCAVSFAGTLNH